MNYSIEIDNDVLLVRVDQKRATVEFAADLKEALLNKIDSGHANVIVDLTIPEFVDSSFLGVLVAGLKKATLNNGDLKIVGLQEPVRAMFELTRLYRIFDIFPSLDDARNSF